MMFGLRPIRFLVAPLVVALPVLAGCSDSTTVDDTIAVVRLTVGTQTALFDQSGLKNCCDGAGAATLPVRITIASTGTVAARTQLTVATFHRADGTNIALDPAVYELQVVPAATRLTFTPLPFPSGANLPFSGNLFRATAGVTEVTMSIVNKASGAPLFGPHKFNVCTTNRTDANGGSATSLDPAILCAT